MGDVRTKELIEALVYKIPNLRGPLESLDIISKNPLFGESREIVPKENEAFKSIIDNFERPHIIAAFNYTQIVIIIEPKIVLRNYPVIVIRGDSCEFEMTSTTKIRDYISNELKVFIFYVSYFAF